MYNRTACVLLLTEVLCSLVYTGLIEATEIEDTFLEAGYLVDRYHQEGRWKRDEP